MMLTLALDCALPPAPVQLSVNVVALVSAGVASLPAVGLLPLQPPEAVQLFAFVVLQVSVLVPPLATEVGDAVSDTVGAGVVFVTDTVVLACRVPPAPLQLSVNDVVALNAPVLALPETDFEPLQPPDAVHEVAFVELQVSVLLPPLATLVGDADSETVGAGVAFVTVTVVLARALRP